MKESIVLPTTYLIYIMYRINTIVISYKLTPVESVLLSNVRLTVNFLLFLLQLLVFLLTFPLWADMKLLVKQAITWLLNRIIECILYFIWQFVCKNVSK